MVDKVIPYLPMDPASNLLVVELKLKKLAETLDGGLYTTSGECHAKARDRGHGVGRGEEGIRVRCGRSAG